MIVPQSDPTIWQYSQDEVNALCGWLSATDGFAGDPRAFILRSLLLIELMPNGTKADGGMRVAKKPVQHWSSEGRSASKTRKDKERSEAGLEGALADTPPWVCIPYGIDPIRSIERVSQPNFIFGVIPAFHLLALIDCDKPDPKAVDEVAEEFGEPIVRYQTRRNGGWHLVYPIRSFDDAYLLTGGGYTVKGIEGYGEVVCGRRFGCLWRPIEYIAAVNARKEMDPADDSINWLEPKGSLLHQPGTHSRPGSTAHKGTAKFNLSVKVPAKPDSDGSRSLLRDPAKQWELLWGVGIERAKRLAARCNATDCSVKDPAGNIVKYRWEGDCPHSAEACGAPSESGNRFHISVGHGGKLHYKCWKCDKEGRANDNALHAEIMRIAEGRDGNEPPPPPSSATLIRRKRRPSYL